jgi:hypothetical protein
VGEASDTRYVTPRLRRAVTQLLAFETGGAPATSENLAAASGRLLGTLSQRLAGVIGPVGVHSILLRAVKLRKSEFAFLDERIVPSESRDSLAEPLRACLQEHEPDVIREASVRLFATFVGLLANIIGDRLTWSLLQQSWPDALLPRTDRQEPEE